MPKKKPRALRNVRRKTGARAQAKQIAALSRQVTNINREQTDSIRTCWQRNNLPIGSGGAVATPYICPLPYALCDPLGASPVPNAQVWSDNRVIAAQPTFSKRLVFGYAEAAAGSNKIYHTGGRLRYTLYTTEPSYTKVTLCLIRAKKNQADQLVTDRNLKGKTTGNQPGSAARIFDDVDYTVHNGAGGSYDTWYGAEINRKYWDVLYSREIALATPKDLSASSVQRVTPVVNGKNNTLVATGSIKLPAAGVVTAVGYATTQNESPATAMEQQYLDQRNEDSLYLVAINNDLQIDTQNVSMGFVVTDYYKAVV